MIYNNQWETCIEIEVHGMNTGLQKLSFLGMDRPNDLPFCDSATHMACPTEENQTGRVAGWRKDSFVYLPRQ